MLKSRNRTLSGHGIVLICVTANLNALVLKIVIQPLYIRLAHVAVKCGLEAAMLGR